MRNYGGAFDINPEEYWSKDDLLALQDAIEDLNPGFTITALYLKENDVIDLEYEDAEGSEWTLEKEIRIDLRKAGTTRELCDTYAQIIADAVNEEIKENNMEREQWEEK